MENVCTPFAREQSSLGSRTDKSVYLDGGKYCFSVAGILRLKQSSTIQKLDCIVAIVPSPGNVAHKLGHYLRF